MVWMKENSKTKKWTYFQENHRGKMSISKERDARTCTRGTQNTKYM